jgi:hypothetical protein
MRKKYQLFFTAMLLTIISYSQSPNLCPALKNYIKIDDSSNIPSVTENTETETITLTFNQQNINDIFDDYLIYDFYQSFPSGSENLQKWYTIAYNSRDLINEINSSVASNIIEVDFTYSSTNLDQSIIDFLDGKQFRYSKTCSDVPEIGESCASNEQIMSDDFNLIVSFTYDNSSDILWMQSDGLTPSGNSFNIGLKGGVENNTLQVWESTVETIAQNPTYDYAESVFNDLLDIGCFEGSHIGDTGFLIDTVENTITLDRATSVFSHDFIILEFYTLSLNKFSLNDLKIYETKNNPYLQISNSLSDSFYVEIFSVSGQLVLEKIPFSDNKILINHLSNNLYFIKVSNSQNQFKVFKFLKR